MAPMWVALTTLLWMMVLRTTHWVTTLAVTMAPTTAGAADASDRCARQHVRARRRLATSRAPLLRRWPALGRVIPTQFNLSRSARIGICEIDIALEGVRHAHWA